MRYAIAPSFWPSIAFVLHHMAARKREKHEQHRIGVPRQRDEMIAAGSPFAREPVFHGALAGTRPPHRLLIARLVEPSSSCNAIAMAFR